MEVNKRRLGTSNRGSSVVAGSVWESRMKSDQVRGGIKVFYAKQEEEENPEQVANNGASKLKKSPIGKRKTWKSETPEGLDKSPIQRGKTENRSNISEGIQKSPIHTRKLGSSERIPIQIRKVRSDTKKNAAQLGGESGKLRKSKSDSVKENEAGSSSGSVNNSIQFRKTKSELDPVQVGSSNGGCDKEQVVENGKNDDAAGENCKDLDVCQEKVVSTSSENVGGVESSSENPVQISNGDPDYVLDDNEEEEEEMNEEVEVEMEEENIEVKEINIPESNVVKEEEKHKVVLVENNGQEKKVIVMNEPEKKKILNEPEPKKVVSAHMRFHLRNERKPPVSASIPLKQSPPIRRNSNIHKNFSENNSIAIPKAKEYHNFPQTQNKLQSLVDLIMWRDVSRSAFVFGFGTFITVSSSYAKDINLSVISVMSYIGLVYLAVIFLYRSLICRGIIDIGDSNYVVGEEDAIWMLKLILPYLNEFLLKLKALFSGDPGTTIKLALLLFVLARCGSFITVWKMAKFGFFVVFTVPKICSSYSAQLTAYGNFWIRRFRDAWDSCTHKKAVALGIFGLVWNLSSVVARIWAVFVLFVAFKYYQQHYLVRDEWAEDEAAACDETWQEPVGSVKQKQERFGTNKIKKGF